jgi:mersacidin/lichenicidin family type 2 lantibiotic
MLETDKIIRAWKDDDYRMSLSADELRDLPENPAGLVEFPGADLNHVAYTFGGARTNFVVAFCCI